MLIFNGYNGLNFDAWQVEWANAVANRKPKVRPPKPPDFLAAPLDSSSKKRKVEEQSPVPAEKGEAGPPEKMMKAAPKFCEGNGPSAKSGYGQPTCQSPATAAAVELLDGIHCQDDG